MKRQIFEMANAAVTGRLAEWFPNAVTMCIPVQVAAQRASGNGLKERTVTEYGTPAEALFHLGLQPKFRDRVHQVNSDASLDVGDCVVAVHGELGSAPRPCAFSKRIVAG